VGSFKASRHFQERQGFNKDSGAYIQGFDEDLHRARQYSKHKNLELAICSAVQQMSVEKIL
jgi:hypothetical protein